MTTSIMAMTNTTMMITMMIMTVATAKVLAFKISCCA